MKRRSSDKFSAVERWITRFMKNVVYSDTSPMLFMCSLAYVIIGLVLSQHGDTLHFRVFMIVDSLMSETMATWIIFLLAGAGIFSLGIERAIFSKIVAMLYTVVFIFIGTSFVLVSPLSIGSVHYVFALSSVWVFLRRSSSE